MKKQEVFGFLAIILAVNAVLYYFAISQQQSWLYDENALMENLQAATALCAGFIALILPKQNNHLAKVAGYAFGFLGLAIFLREVDVERLPYDIPAFLVWLGHGIGRNLMLVVLLALVLWQTKPVTGLIKNNLGALITTPVGLLMGSALAVLLLSDLFERGVIGGASHVFYEELMELNGFALFLFASTLIRSSFEKFGVEINQEVEFFTPANQAG